MVGREQPMSKEARRSCAAIADELNYKRDHVEHFWQQIAWEVEFSCQYPREVAECMASRITRDALDLRGRLPS